MGTGDEPRLLNIVDDTARAADDEDVDEDGEERRSASGTEEVGSGGEDTVPSVDRDRVIVVVLLIIAD